jgi:hypothetical protein
VSNVDVREVLLVTIRGRLLDDDVDRLRGGASDRRRLESVAEQALDAALARGATLAEVYAITVDESSSRWKGCACSGLAATGP